MVIYYQCAYDFCFLHYSSVRTIDLCTKQWYTFSGLIAKQMVVISFKLEKDFLCNFYCTIFEYNYGLLYTFFSFVCYNVLSFFFFKRFLIFSIHTSNMNCRYNYPRTFLDSIYLESVTKSISIEHVSR